MHLIQVFLLQDLPFLLPMFQITQATPLVRSIPPSPSDFSVYTVPQPANERADI